MFKSQNSQSSIQMLRAPNLNSNVNSDFSMESFHSRGQHLCKFIETKENVFVRKEFNSHRIVLVHQHDRRFIVLEHQYGRRDVMWKRSIGDSIGHFRVAWSLCFKARLRAKLLMSLTWKWLFILVPGGYPWEFLVGVCRPVLQILTLFRTKKWNSPHPFSD